MHHDDTADTLLSATSPQLSASDRERLEDAARQLWAEIEAVEGEAALRRSLTPTRRPGC